MFLSNRKPEIHWNDMTSVLRVQFTLVEYCAYHRTSTIALHRRVQLYGTRHYLLCAMILVSYCTLYAYIRLFEWSTFPWALSTLDIVSPLFISNDVGYLYSSTCICTSTGMSIIQCTGVPNITTLSPSRQIPCHTVLLVGYSSTPSIDPIRMQ